MEKDKDFEPSCIIQTMNEFRKLSSSPNTPLFSFTQESKPDAHRVLLEEMENDRTSLREDITSSIASASKRESFNVPRMLSEFTACTTVKRTSYSRKYKSEFLGSANGKRKLIEVDEFSTPDKSKIKKQAESLTCKEILESPWEARQKKVELIMARKQITNLEARIARLHTLHKETVITFDEEKQALISSQQADQTKISELENHLAAIRKRESIAVNELTAYKRETKGKLSNLEKEIFTLKNENQRLQDKLQEAESNIQNVNSTQEQAIMLLKFDLDSTKQQLTDVTNRNTSIETQLQQHNKMQHQLQMAEDNLKLANLKLMNLQQEQESYKETADIVKRQEQKLLKHSILEKEVAELNEENKKLRDLLQNKLLLEEMVSDLKMRQAKFEEREKDLLKVQADYQRVQQELEEWTGLAKSVCDSMTSCSAETVKSIVLGLQQRELCAKAEACDLHNKLTALQLKFDSVSAELERAKTESKKHHTEHEQQMSVIRRMQKKLLLISVERDSYRSQLDSYEHDLTTSPALSSHHTQQSNRIEVLQKSLDGFKELVEKLEEEVAVLQKEGGSPGMLDKLKEVERERDTLKKENEYLMKDKDELKTELEYRALKGDFNPLKTKVMHLRMNPTDELKEKHADELTQAQTECARLRERVKVLESGQSANITNIVEENLAASNSQEVKELRQELESKELKMKKLQELFKASGKEFREACYLLLGYKIDRIKKNQYQLASMYAESADDNLLFQLKPGGDLDLLETVFSSSVSELIEENLKVHNSIPMFLCAITQYLFHRQTLLPS